MTITTFTVGAAVTPTVVKTYISHYANRKPRHEKPTAHISYDEGLQLIRTFLKYASHHSVEDLQSFTAQWVPSPSWVRTENVTIPDEHVSKATRTIVDQLGPSGVEQVGGSKWWQWRPRGGELKAEWIEMRAHYNEQKRQNSRSRRIMLYVHGGGYFFGSVDEHRYQMQRHARKLKARVFAPRYRLAPQFPFPCGLQDCLASYLYLLSVHDPTEIILAGDSAGGGMVVALLCLIRDQNLPLPAGAILISPWVDLTHSFPSLGENAELDYIPPYGFMQKPSASWPPPNQEEIANISRLANVNTVSAKDAPNKNHTADSIPAGNGEVKPGPQLPLSIELDGKLVVLNDQIQMYATNQLLAHPLVSPVLQPSLGGLPPVLILTGGAEILRDEQIYLAHKMANPSKYPLGTTYRSIYDPDDKILKRYKPTPVQLQVWDDLCHVAPTLSFTRPAKFMYRSIAQFGAWVLAKAQKRAIEIVDDDSISIISSQSGSESQTDAELESSVDSITRAKVDVNKTLGSVGRAGDPIPPFENNMIRQRIDRHGKTYPLAEPHDMPGLRMHPDEVGVIKPGPVRKWLDARHLWDTKYASTRRKVQKERVRALASGKLMAFEAGEHPPPSALAGRRTDKDLPPKKNKKSYGLAMWSGWGSKHDETTLKREEEAVDTEQAPEKPAPEPESGVEAQEQDVPDSQLERDLPTPVSPQRSRKRSLSSKRQASESRARGRKRTISVTDRGQAEGRFIPPAVPALETAELSESPVVITSPASPQDERAKSPNPSLLAAGFLPKFKPGLHVRDDGGDESRTPVLSDAASAMTGRTGIVADDASTRAVFAASGVSKKVETEQPNRTKTTSLSSTARPQSPLMSETTSLASDHDDRDDEAASIAPSALSRPYASIAVLGSDTPRSQRSLDRLHSHQLDDGMGRLAPLRSPSSTAIVRAEGIVGTLDAHNSEQRDYEAKDISRNSPAETHEAGEPASAESPRPSQADINGFDKAGNGDGDGDPQRPTLYDRKDTEFLTAMEKVS